MPESRVDRSQLIPQESESESGFDALISLWDLDLKLVDSSKKFKEHVGLGSRTGITLRQAYPALAKPALAAIVQLVIDTGQPRTIRLDASMPKKCDLLLFYIRTGLLVIEIDGADAKKKTSSEDGERARLIHQATHDVLTGLSNRRQFSAELEKLLPASGEAGPALMQLDLDDFKPVNDTLGHGAGDVILQLAAERIKKPSVEMGRSTASPAMSSPSYRLVRNNSSRLKDWRTLWSPNSRSRLSSTVSRCSSASVSGLPSRHETAMRESS